MATVKFEKAAQKNWLGNGFGYSSCVWKVNVDGREVGFMDSMGRAYGWTFRDTREERGQTPRIRREYLADLKKAVVERFGGEG